MEKLLTYIVRSEQFQILAAAESNDEKMVEYLDIALLWIDLALARRQLILARAAARAKSESDHQIPN